MFRNQAFAGALAFLCTVFGAFSAPVSAQTESTSAPASAIATGEPGIRLEGARGVTESTATIMQRQAAAPPARPRPEHELEYPDRSQLPQNLLAAPTARFPADTPLTPTRTSPDMHTTSVAFDGATLTDTGAFPPDSMGTIGPDQYVVFVNGRIRSFTRAGVADGVINVGPDVFFAPVMTPVGGTVVLNFTSDPQVRYDRFTGRWYMSIIDVPCTTANCSAVGANRWMLAVSDAASNGTITAATNWSMFFVQTDAANFCDYPSLGVDVNALYFGCNMFTPANAFAGTNGYVVQKTSVLGAGPMVVTGFANLAASSGAGPFSPRGVDNLDASATDGYFIGVDNATFGTLMVRRVTAPGSATPTISANISVAVSTTQFPNPVTHLGNTGGNNGRLDSLDDRLYAATVRNGQLWTAHSFRVNAAGVASTVAAARNATRWYQLQNLATTPTLVQSGTVFDSAATLAAARQYWIPTIAPTGQGHAVLGFSMAGNPVGATPAYVGRLVSDAAGTMVGPPATGAVLFGTSAASYNPPSDPGGAAGRRWGDYSYTVVDPLDEMSVWTIQEYNQATNSYAVRIAKLLAPPPATPTCSGSPIAFGGGTGNVVITATSSSGSGFFDPGANLPPPARPFNHLSATVTNATVNSVSYDSPTQVTLNITANVAGLQDVTLANPDGQSVTATGCVDVVPVVVTHTVTPGVSGGNGTIAPSTPQTVNDGDTASFTLTPNGGFHIDTVGGSCGGSLVGNVYTTAAVLTDCTVVASFAIDAHTVTPSVSGGNGTITPSTPQIVNDGATTSFTLIPDGGFHIDTVGGTCGGSLAGNVYTTNPVTADCTVVASFAAGGPPACTTGGAIEVSATAGTPGPTGYTTLKGAFDAINTGTHQGSVAINVCANSHETASAVLNGSGSGSSSYTDVTIHPVGGVERTIDGAILGPIVDLAGANHVTIDGLNSGGNALTFWNTAPGVTAGTSTIRFINGASNNTVTRCRVLGSSGSTVATAGGSILFSTSTVAGGNSNNTISGNNIGPAGALQPTKGVMGLGTAANPNVGNVIDGNNIYDVFGPSLSSASVNIQAANNNWTISNNRIYQTAPRTFTATAQRYSGILVAAAGGTFVVTGNTIGFGAADGTGTTTISGSTNEFRGIAFTNSNTTAGSYSTIQGNTISGINVTSGRNSATTDLSSFIGIQSGSSATDAPANVIGNTIGSLDGSSTIVVNATSMTANTAPVQGILDFNFVGGVSNSNNNIGSITINNGGTGTVAGFRGILVSSTTGALHTVSNNTIGGSAAGSITDTVVGQVAMYGIQIGGANVMASGNVVSNMAGNSMTANGVVLSGILSTGSTGANTISQNTIHSLSNNSGAASNSIYALYCSFATVAGNLVERNLVHSLSINSTATTNQLVGILPVAGSGTYQNNMVRLGVDASGASITSGYVMFGMFEIGGTNSLYDNSVYIGGSGVTSASNTFGLVSNVTTGTRNYVGNILWNARSNVSGAGKNYAISLAGTTGVTTDYNDLIATGAGGLTGALAGVDALALADWQAATAQDANSIAADPLFVAPTGTAATVDLHVLAGSPAIAAGTPIAGVTNDFDGDTRSLTNPALGADEYVSTTVTHTVTPSVGTPSGTITPSVPQTVNDGSTTAFTLSPDPGFQIDSVGGTCAGSLAGNVYTTNAVTADCTVIANFTAVTVTHVVTPSVGTPAGTIAPSTPQVVDDGATTAFSLTPDVGFQIDSVGGTCAGALVGAVFTTAPVTADCTVIANFTADPVADVSPGTLSFNVGAGGTGSNPLHIANTGGGTLTWSLAEAPASLPSAPGADVGASAAIAMRPVSVPAGPVAFGQSDLPAGLRGRAVTVIDDAQIAQMADNTPVSPNGIACGQTGVNTSENSWWRRFYFNEYPAVGASASISAVTIAVESGPSIPVSVNLYTIPHGVTVDTIPTGQLTLIGSGSGTIGGTLASVTIPVNGTVADTTAMDLVVEYHIDGAPTPFFPGGNSSTQTHPMFISAASCGITTPTNPATIGFPDFHVIMVVNVADGGTPGGCDNPADVPWLSAAPTSGSVAGGDVQDSAIGVDATGLAPGTYSAHLCVATNDPTHALVNVPVSLTVGAPPVPPTVDKAFSPDSVLVDTDSVLTLTLSNTNASPATLTTPMVDTFPIGLEVSAPDNALTTCPGGVVTALPGAGSFSLSSGAQIPANGSCTVSVNVRSSAAGSYVNTVAAGALQTDAGNNVAPATATLTVTPALVAPTLGKAFAPGSVTVGTSSALTLTLGNTNAAAATLTAALTDTFPSGLVVANPANAATTCPGGTVGATAGSGSVSLSSGAQIPASGSCTVTVSVQSATAGTYVNTIAAGALQTTVGTNASPASATLTVTPVIITDRIFCDGFDGAACAPSDIELGALYKALSMTRVARDENAFVKSPN